MKQFFAILVFVIGFTGVAKADVWSWVDANGKTHFVDTMKSIFTWVDEAGAVHYSDTPEHQDAVSVELVWVSSGTLDNLQAKKDASEPGYAYPGESPDDRAEREKVEAYYCKRATEIYESYVSAPRLYRTNDSGEREYLSKEDAANTIADMRKQRDEQCR
jgi:hypothetical protein